MNLPPPALPRVRREAMLPAQLFLVCVISLVMLATAAHGATTFAATGSLGTGRYNHTATLLPNGLVLVAGGYGSGGQLASAELYNPATGAWTTTGSLANARYNHTATLLANGQVLVTGGNSTGGPLYTAEV